MLICPTCGQENPEGFRFCGACAAPLAEELPAPRDERKVVSVVFCDLVGSTARAERMDPEDVRVMLSRYHGRVRYELERFGGTVEKFIGDAVMALFGAPVAHEDDPERAVRAALAIREWASEEGCRCGSGSRPARRWSRSPRGRQRVREWHRATLSTPPRACSLRHR
ncbi:MAG: adenylate/guanylate cyclase domain-containing protein [Gaiellaceae bacterium]